MSEASRGCGRREGGAGKEERARKGKKRGSNLQNPSFCLSAKKPLTPPGGWGGPPRTLSTRGVCPGALRTRHPMFEGQICGVPRIKDAADLTSFILILSKVRDFFTNLLISGINALACWRVKVLAYLSISLAVIKLSFLPL